MRYPDSVEYLYSLGNEVKSLKFGLETITAVLDALGNPQNAFRSVHVAGTNGKGSTCAMIASALRASGRWTGLYTSPHLVQPTERIVIDGAPVSEDEFAAAFAQVHQCAEGLLAQGRISNHPTYFETVTAMGFLLFRDRRVDIAVVEVGLGGRLDATNVVLPELCVITPVDFDHEQFLGYSLQEIAGEKAGILKSGVPAVFSRQRPEAAAALAARAANLGIDVVRTEEYEVENLEIAANGCRFTARRKRELEVDCPLRGAHQAQNALTAAAALDRIGVRPEAIAAGLASVVWPGRLEQVCLSPEIILDGAHNPAGARALADYIKTFYSGRHIVLVYGAMRDKSVQEITEILFPLATEIFLTAPSQSRAVRPEALLASADHAAMRIAPTVQDAITAARKVAPGGVVFVTGSLYLVGEARSLFVQ